MGKNPERPPRGRQWAIVTCVYVGLIFALASLPTKSIRSQSRVSNRVLEVLQNTLHIPLYGGLAWLLLRAAPRRSGAPSVLTATAVILLSLMVALTDEWIQSKVPGRHASVFDLGLDLLGVLAVAIPALLKGRRQQRL